MIDRVHVLQLTRQASLLRLSRSSVYYLPRQVPPARLVIMRRIDELHLEHPFAGSRMLRDMLRGRHHDWPSGGGDDDAANEHRGAVSAAEYVQTGTWAQDLAVFAAQPGGGSAEPGLGDGHHLDPDGAGLCLSGGGGGLV